MWRSLQQYELRSLHLNPKEGCSSGVGSPGRKAGKQRGWGGKCEKSTRTTCSRSLTVTGGDRERMESCKQTYELPGKGRGPRGRGEDKGWPSVPEESRKVACVSDKKRGTSFSR